MDWVRFMGGGVAKWYPLPSGVAVGQDRDSRTPPTEAGPSGLQLPPLPPVLGQPALGCGVLRPLAGGTQRGRLGDKLGWWGGIRARWGSPELFGDAR